MRSQGLNGKEVRKNIAWCLPWTSRMPLIPPIAIVLCVPLKKKVSEYLCRIAASTSGKSSKLRYDDGLLRKTLP